jgi:hypothetical protein
MCRTPTHVRHGHGEGFEVSMLLSCLRFGAEEIEDKARGRSFKLRGNKGYVEEVMKVKGSWKSQTFYLESVRRGSSHVPQSSEEENSS